MCLQPAPEDKLYQVSLTQRRWMANCSRRYTGYSTISLNPGEILCTWPRPHCEFRECFPMNVVLNLLTTRLMNETMQVRTRVCSVNRLTQSSHRTLPRGSIYGHCCREQQTQYRLPPTRLIIKVKVRVKVHTLDIPPLCSESPPQKRSGMARVLKGFHSFTCTPTCSSAIGMSHRCLCLPSRSWYSFTDPGGMEG